MGYSRRTSNYLERIALSDPSHMMSMADPIAIGVETLRIDSACLTCHFCASLKHKDDGQTKFIKSNSQRQDIIIKYWVSIGSIHREQG